MELKQSCNVFLPVEQYGEIKDLGHRLSIPYSELIREGVRLVLKKYNRKENNVGVMHND
ncbi:MAG: ribbon-helix-helix domain-containing protein [Candidatus Scalindua sp.]|nr:ribbon-helix-helix domain-containing protein [Candidatus Scalindua sp.]